MARTNGQIAKAKSIKAVQFIIFVLVISILVLLVHRLIINYAYPTDYSEYVEKWCATYNVDEALAYSVILVESDFNSSKVGGEDKNKFGLMQIDKKEYSYIFNKIRITDGDKHKFEDMVDPETNIKYGVYYLKLLNEKYNNDTKTVLAAIHEGTGTVDGWLNVKEYSIDGKRLTSFVGDKLNAYINKVEKARKIYTKIVGEEYIWQIV